MEVKYMYSKYLWSVQSRNWSYALYEYLLF